MNFFGGRGQEGPVLLGPFVQGFASAWSGLPAWQVPGWPERHMQVRQCHWSFCEFALKAVDDACHDAVSRVARMNLTGTNQCQEFLDFSIDRGSKDLQGHQQGL